MRGGTHTLAGVALAVLVAAPAPPLILLGAGIAGGIGALLPDLDHPKSSISRRAWIAGASLRLVVSHRGALHSLIAAGAAMLLAALSPADWSEIILSASIGYCSHIALDALTVSGVPLLWPWGKRFRLMRIRTGGISERLFAVMIFCGFLLFMVNQL